MRCVLRRCFDRIELPEGCWVWKGTRTTGYGRVHTGDGMKLVHRLLYEYLVGDIPEGLDIDHLCRNRACVNPRHLEPVTRLENLLRGDTNIAAHAEGRDCGLAGCVSCAHPRAAALRGGDAA